MIERLDFGGKLPEIEILKGYEGRPIPDTVQVPSSPRFRQDSAAKADSVKSLTASHRACACGAREIPDVQDFERIWRFYYRIVRVMHLLICGIFS